MKNSLLNRKEAALTNQLPVIKILVIGDSHLAAGFNTKHFGHQSFNYAGSGENYLQNFYKLNSVLEQPNAIKTVILPFELHSASSFRNNRITDHSYYGKQIPLLKEAISQQNISLVNDFIKSKAFSYLDQLGNWRKWQKGFKPREIKDGIEVRSKNFANSTNQQQIANRFAKLQFKDATVPDQFALSHLNRMIQLCKQKNKQPILVRMPVSKNYLEEVAKYQNLDTIENGATTYRIKHFPDIPFFDLRDSITNLHHFSDGNHLNFDGSIKLSKSLAKAMQEKGVL